MRRKVRLVLSGEQANALLVYLQHVPDASTLVDVRGLLVGAIQKVETTPVVGSFSLSNAIYNVVKASRPPSGQVIQYKVTKERSTDSYYVALSNLGFCTCTCKDYIHTCAGTRKVCKHIQEMKKSRFFTET